MNDLMLEPADDVRPWRRVSAGLRIQSAGLRLALVLAVVSGALLLIVDRSDRGLPVVMFCGGQLLLAIAQVVGLALISAGPDSDTRRQARRTGWLVVTASVLLAVIPLTIFWPARLGTIPDAVQRQVVTGAFLSLLVNLAILGYLWLGVHAALGSDMGDPRLTLYAARFADAWLVVCTCAVAVNVMQLVGKPLSAVDPFQSTLTAYVVTVLEAIYLALVEKSRRAVEAAPTGYGKM